MTAPEAAVDDDPPAPEREGFGSLGSVLQLLLLAWGAFVALWPLNDNSFFTHLATGRLILERGSVPSTDPYTFTAGGEPWTVQSWLASLAYAGAEQLGGLTGLRVLVLVVFLIATALVWRLTRAAGSLIPRLLLASVAMVICSEVWSERPYMIGFLGIGLVWLALEGRFNPWLLVPFMWVWANTHGSFPFALLLWGAVAIGTVLDGRAGSAHAGGEWRDWRAHLPVLRSILLGLLASIVSPLGFRAVIFPFEGLARSDTLRLIVEWQAPEFTSIGERAFLLLVCAAIAALVARPRWRHAIPAVIFIAAALVARRNLVMAIPVLVPIVAAALPTLGTLRSTSRPRLGPAIAALSVAVVVMVAASAFSGPAVGLGGYPVSALQYLDGTPGGRVVTQDFTGNLLELLDGPTGEVFIDDRADMFSPELIEEFRVLNVADPSWAATLERWEAEHVVWSRSHPFATVLASDPGWRIVFSSPGWIVAVQR